MPSPSDRAEVLELAERMAEISRALASGHLDRAFVLLCQSSPPAIAAAFLLEEGILVDELPRDAKRAIVDWKREQEQAA